MSNTALYDKVVGGYATDAELEEYFGADTMNQLAHGWRGDHDSKAAFIEWYRAVMQPIGIDQRAAWRMFSGQTSIEDFVATLDVATLDKFLELYPDLQAAYQTKLDARWQNDARRRKDVQP